MISINAIFKKEMKTRLRYRIVWINMALTPFFIIGPYVFTSKGINVHLEGSVLVGCFIWYWLNQYFFGLGDAFSEERELGTLVNVALSPMSFLKFLIGKGLWIFVECIYITTISMLIFKLVGINKGTSLLMLLVYSISGIYIFTFSIFFSALVLFFKKLSSINFLVQQGLGILCGTTVKVNNYPKIIQLIANIIPLTFSIKIGRDILNGNGFSRIAISLLILTALSVFYFILGIYLLKKVEKSLRIKGEWELW